MLLLAVLSLWDLRIELQLLLQHFTFAALRAAVLAHPLAVVVLFFLPTLQRLTLTDRHPARTSDLISSSGPSRP